MQSRIVIHVIPNAHLDPVWLWDWREGLNEGISTIRTVLDLMDEFDELTFVRGEAVIYRHVERFDPVTFARIAKMVDQGRWDIVGGTLLQMDTNLPCTEVFDRQFETGKRYFRERFGKEVTVAWAADSFGHSGGLPDILTRHGIESFAFTRPPEGQMPLARSVFRWKGVKGAEVLAYRPTSSWYGTERGEVPRRLDSCLKDAQQQGLANIACFLGLGNHGGGPTRRHVLDVLAWRETHPEVTVRFSGLHQLFKSLRQELSAKPDAFAPVLQGELGFTLRGCYSSAATFKFAYRRAEAAVIRAQKTIDAVAVDPAGNRLEHAWNGLLFNSFHDILPGSSIERAMAEQVQWIGGVLHHARSAEFEAINYLQSQIDTRVLEKPVGDMPTAATLLVFNPHDREFDGYLELEAALDYRPIFSYQDRVRDLPVRLLDGGGQAVAFQRIAAESSFMVNVPWRMRVLTRASLPPRGWSVYDLAYVESTVPIETSASAHSPGEGVIANEDLKITAAPGASGIHVDHRGRNLFQSSGLGFGLFADGQGSWGDMSEKITHHANELESWTIRSSQVIEHGPHRATMIVHFAGARSEIDLTLSVCHGRNALDVSARLFWNERGPRLKMILPAGDNATFDVPGGTITRGPTGEVPGGRWVIIHSKHGDVGFASNALYNFDSSQGVTRATIVRSAPFASDVVAPDATERRLPVQDRGEHQFKFTLTPAPQSIAAESLFLEQPVIVQTVPAHNSTLPRSGKLAERVLKI